MQADMQEKRDDGVSGMTARERFLACTHFKEMDRAPLWEWNPWPSTLRRWQREGLAPGQRPPQYAECDKKILVEVDVWMLPRYEEHVISEDEHSVTKLSERGVVERTLKDPDHTAMPEYMEYPIKTRADWESLKKRFDPADPMRFPAQWRELCAEWHEDKEAVLNFEGRRQPSLFGFVRELLGPERVLYAFYDEPEMIHDMMESNTEFLLGLLQRILEDVPLTTMSFWEDMCYRAGPLISPEMFREFMVPRYKRITELLNKHGVDAIFVDCDGDVSELLPLWIEAGVNGVYPMEVAAGMDVVALRREYGKDLLMTGGIDKRVLAKTRKDIDEEVERKLPLAEKGGYIPHLDHSVPEDVPYENFVYYWERKKAIMGIQ